MGATYEGILGNNHADGFSSVAISDTTEAVVTFAQAITDFDKISAQHWDVYNTDSSVTTTPSSSNTFYYTSKDPTASQIYATKALTNQTVKVWFNPPLIPQRNCTVVCDVTDQGFIGGVLESTMSGVTSYYRTSASFSFTSPTVDVALGNEWRHGMFKAISRAAGQLIQEFTSGP